MVDSELWIDKFRPTKIKEIVCNERAVHRLVEWLEKFNKQKVQIEKEMKIRKKSKKSSSKKIVRTVKSCALVTGNHGVGKSLSVETVLNEYGYKINKIKFNNIKGIKGIKGYLNNMTQSVNIMNMMNKQKNKQMAIVVDEVESITSTTEKSVISSLLKINESDWICPVIFISTNQHSKQLSNIKNSAHLIDFGLPKDYELKRIVDDIIKKEKIALKNESVKRLIIEHAQHDIRRLINILQNIKYAYSDKTITKTTISEYCDISSKKDLDPDLYRETLGLMFEYKSVDDCLRYYETEKVLLPLMMHQNYIEAITKNCDDIETRYELISTISESLSEGDVVENYIYGDQNWDMQEIHGFHTCVKPSYLICNNLPEDEDGNPDPTIIRMLFSKDLNKTSIKNINKKNISNTNRCFKDMNIFDYIMINKIIRKLINNGDIDGCIKLLRPYGVKLEHIESLLKIDKIKDTKTSLTSKQKKEFEVYLGKN